MAPPPPPPPPPRPERRAMSGDATTLPRKRLFGAIRDLLCSGEDALAAAAPAAAEPPRQRVRPSPTRGLLDSSLSQPQPQLADPTAPGRRVTIADLLVAPPRCAACLEHVRGVARAYTCLACFGSFCEACLASYAAMALADVALLPLRCASTGCRAPIPLSSVLPLLSSEDATALADAQQRVLRPPERVDFTVNVTRCDGTTAANRAGEICTDMNSTLSPGADADAQLEQLMEREGWQRCPRCGNGVERTRGCRHIVCICGGEFCYQCGDIWSPGMMGCSRQCGLSLTAAVVPAVDDGILLPGDGGEQDLNTNEADHQGNLAAHLFDHMRDQVWRRLLELLEDLRVQQLGNHLRRGDGRNCHDIGRRSSEAGDVFTNRLNSVDIDLEHVAVDGSENFRDERQNRNWHVIPPSQVPSVPADFQVGEPSFPRRVAVYDLVHSDNPVSELHNAIHVQYASTHRSMKLSSLVLHNLDYLLHDDETMD